MNAAQTAKASIELKLSLIAGCNVEVTIRGDRSFTFYFDGINAVAAQKLADTCKGEKVTIEADEELGTCVYVN